MPSGAGRILRIKNLSRRHRDSRLASAKRQSRIEEVKKGAASAIEEEKQREVKRERERERESVVKRAAAAAKEEAECEQ